MLFRSTDETRSSACCNFIEKSDDSITGGFDVCLTSRFLPPRSRSMARLKTRRVSPSVANYVDQNGIVMTQPQDMCSVNFPPGVPASCRLFKIGLIKGSYEKDDSNADKYKDKIHGSERLKEVSARGVDPYHFRCKCDNSQGCEENHRQLRSEYEFACIPLLKRSVEILAAILSNNPFPDAI